MTARCLLLMLFFCAGCQTREKVEPLSNIRMEMRMTSPASPFPARKRIEPAPKLRVAWEPAFDLAFISLTITNEDAHPVTIDPQMGFLINDPRISEIGPMAGAVQIAVTSADLDEQPLVWEMVLNRPQAWPVVIAPGETRKVKVSVEGYAMDPHGKPVKPNRVVFSLQCDGKELTRQAVVKRGGPWKRWRVEASPSAGLR